MAGNSDKAKADKPEGGATTRSAGKVLYSGTSNVRTITKEDFKAVKVDHDTLVWDASNLFMVPIEEIQLKEEEFKRIIEADPDFKLIDADFDKLPKSHPHNNRYNPGDTFTAGLADGVGGGSATPTSTAPATGGSTGGAGV